MHQSDHPRQWHFAMKPLAACLALAVAGGGPVLAQPANASGAAAPIATAGIAPRIGLLHPSPRTVRHASTAPHAPVPSRPAAVLAVTSCGDDADPGTLRNVAATAASGDTLDLSALACSTITLEQGAIVTDVDDLTLLGPDHALAIDGSGTSSIVVHYGSGTLSIDRLTITNGYFDGGGGCIFSQGNLALSNTTVTGCKASAAYGFGAGALARGDLTLVSSTLSNNSGALAGGGAVANGQVNVTNSTISGNSAAIWGGGLYATGAVTIRNSTITGNHAEIGGGGVFLAYARPTTLTSVIVAANTAGANADYAADIGAGYPMSIDGSNNLIVSSDPALPADTLASDPLLLPLADNGGPTPTHALAAGSPAIDAGSNDTALEYDQRGTGFARSVGAGTDIGAFEVQGVTDDTIFADGFDG